MRAPVSVVIPTLRAADSLPGCAAALFEGVQAGLIRELIVSDGGSNDATTALADELGAEVVTGPAGRGGQLARGAAVARGEWLLFLHADTQLAPGWTDAVAARIAAGGPGVFRLRFDRGGVSARIVAGWANWRSRSGLPYGDQGLLIARADYDAVGGFADIPLMEDVDIARRLNRAGLRPVVMGAEAVTSADRYVAEGWARRGARNLWMLARYLAGADPARLAREYRR